MDNHQVDFLYPGRRVSRHAQFHIGLLQHLRDLSAIPAGQGDDGPCACRGAASIAWIITMGSAAGADRKQGVVRLAQRPDLPREDVGILVIIGDRGQYRGVGR